MRNHRLSIILTIVLSFLLAGLAQAAEFSADVLMQGRGQEHQSKIYVKGDKVRQEISTPRGESVSILRRDQKVMWMLMPGQKSYLEMPLNQQAFARAMNMPEASVSKKFLGTETLNGYETDKYETTVTTRRGTVKSTIWLAKKLGVPIRIESADKSFRVDYKNIKVGGVDDAVFEVPAGYQKMSMPAGMPMMK
jgi:outer membrane lipoprotein-sorting protein